MVSHDPMAEVRNINEVDLDVLAAFLDEHDAPLEVRESLDGLRRRWELGRDINHKRLLAWRRDQARLRELEKGQ